jgi:4-diphosphocytidyl-2-C-methyl-D-erythritol kinase
MIFSSPAKINLSLKIVRKRSDGFHDIDSDFQFLNWGDKIEIYSSNKLSVSTTKIQVSQQENLVTEALKKIESYCDTNLNYFINIEKNIPLGSGLGGGSSNAATAMLAVNSLAKLNLSLDVLVDLGKSLGSDIPFFLKGLSGRVTGLGEIIQPKEFPEDLIMILFPECSISTKDAYSAVTLEEISSKKDRLKGNFFEEWVLINYPQAREVFDFISKNKEVHISGTGSSMFTKINSFEEGKEIMDNAPRKLAYVITNTINKSPLLNELLNSGV